MTRVALPYLATRRLFKNSLAERWITVAALFRTYARDKGKKIELEMELWTKR